MENKPRFPNLEREAARHTTDLTEQARRKAGVEQKAKELMEERKRNKKALSASNTLNLLKEAAQLIKVSTGSVSLGITENKALINEDPKIVLAWNLSYREEPGIGSDSFPTTYYSWNQITCEARDENNFVIKGKNQQPINDSATRTIADVIDTSFSSPESIYNSYSPPLSNCDPIH